MKRSSIIVLTFLVLLFQLPTQLRAQTNLISYKFVITVSSQEIPVAEAEVRVFDKNEVISTIYTDKKGKFETLLLRNGEYVLEISKDGYYTKRILVKTNVENGVKKLPSVKMDAELISEDVYKDAEQNDPEATSILDFPSIIIEYDEEIGDFNYREAYSKHISEEIKKIND